MDRLPYMALPFWMTDLLWYSVTVFWLLGFLEATAQVLFIGPYGQVTGWSVYLSGAMFAAAFLLSLRQVRAFFNSLWREYKSSPFLFRLLVGVALAMLALAGAASRLPPHLSQEYDAINYHMALPKQHLLAGSLAHILWSAADLFPMPIQWGFAPFWSIGSYPNKVPQFLAAIAGMYLLLDLGRRQDPGRFTGWIPALAVYTTHGIMIQLGTAMMDLVDLYFLLAIIHSWVRGRDGWAALHLGVFSASKSFRPFECAFVGLIVILVIYQTRRELLAKAALRIRRTLLLTIGVFIPLVARSAYVSLERAGTPFFPIGTCLVSIAPGCKGESGQAVRLAASAHIEAGLGYGYGKDPLSFARFLWSVSVPGEGSVNNAFDYPLGLAWLLLVILLAFCLPFWIKSGRPPVYALLTGGFFFAWWLVSHQSRWLYPVLAFGWLATFSTIRNINLRLLLFLLVTSSGFSLISMGRALGPTLTLSPRDIAASQSEQAAVLGPGIVDSVATLYVDQPIYVNLAQDRYWILTK